MLDLSMLKYQDDFTVVAVPRMIQNAFTEIMKRHHIAGWQFVNPKEATPLMLQCLFGSQKPIEDPIAATAMNAVPTAPDIIKVLDLDDPELSYETDDILWLCSYFTQDAVYAALKAIWRSDEYKDFLTEQVRESQELYAVAEQWSLHPAPYAMFSYKPKAYMNGAPDY